MTFVKAGCCYKVRGRDGKKAQAQSCLAVLARFDRMFQGKRTQPLYPGRTVDKGVYQGADDGDYHVSGTIARTYTTNDSGLRRQTRMVIHSKGQADGPEWAVPD